MKIASLQEFNVMLKGKTQQKISRKHDSDISNTLVLLNNLAVEYLSCAEA